MDSVNQRAVFWAGLLAAGFFCLWRAYRLGKGGADDQRNIRDQATYSKVKLWGAAGIFLVAMVTIDLLFLPNPPPPSKR